MSISERLEKTKERLSSYYEAEISVLTNQSYKIGSRELTRADLDVIKTTIEKLENAVEELESMATGKGKRKSYRITPRDL